MLAILVITGPIYIIIAVGYAAGRSGLFSRSDMRALGKFVVNFALPALLFNALAQRRLTEIINGGYLAAYGGASIALLLLAYAHARYGRRKSQPYSAFYGMGMAFSNSGFIGYSIVLQWLGPPAAVALALCMLVENLVLLPLTLALAESGGVHGETWQRAVIESLRRVMVNPMIIAIIAGLAVALAGIKLPAMVAQTISMLALASTAIALFVIGGTLVGIEVRGMIGDVSAIVVGKLLLHPLAVLALLLVLPPFDPRLQAAAVAYASAPMLSIYPILAQKYDQEAVCAAALLVTTILSFVTISAFLWIVSSLLGWTT